MAESGLATSSVGLPAETTTELASFPAGQPLDDYIHQARSNVEDYGNYCSPTGVHCVRQLLRDMELICCEMDKARIYLAPFQGQPIILARATEVTVIAVLVGSLARFHRDYDVFFHRPPKRDMKGRYTPLEPLSWFKFFYTKFDQKSLDLQSIHGWNYPLVVRHDLHSTIEQACFYRPGGCRGRYQHVVGSRPLRLVRPLSEM